MYATSCELLQFELSGLGMVCFFICLCLLSLSFVCFYFYIRHKRIQLPWFNYFAITSTLLCLIIACIGYSIGCRKSQGSIVLSSLFCCRLLHPTLDGSTHRVFVYEIGRELHTYIMCSNHPLNNLQGAQRSVYVSCTDLLCSPCMTNTDLQHIHKMNTILAFYMCIITVTLIHTKYTKCSTHIRCPPDIMSSTMLVHNIVIKT